MDRLTIALATSALAHAGAVVWLALPGPRRPTPAPEELAPILISLVTPPSVPAAGAGEPIELTLFTLPPEAAPPPAAAAPRRSASPPASSSRAPAPAGAVDPTTAPTTAPTTDRLTRGSTVAAGTAETAPGAEPATGTGGAPGSGLRMRGTGPVRLVMPNLEKIAQAGAPPPPPVVATGELQASGGGRHRADLGATVARVGRDGSVRFSDKRNLHVSLALPSARAVGNALADWYTDPYAQTRDPEREPLPSGVVDDAEEQRKRPGTVPIITGGFDVTDWVMRMAGRDPYWAVKLSFLDRTRAERVELATAHRAELLRGVVAMMRGHLERAWSMPATMQARRRALFELWDDCAETGDAELLEAAGRARAAVLGFIRGHLPPDGPEAYSTGELEALNRKRHSRQPFAPYQESAEP